MKKNKISVIGGTGILADSSTVAINNDEGREKDRFTAKHIIIATGGRPRIFSRK